ncbi:MAG: hypothetical protein ACOH2H_26015 [Cypionkella sp.]
MERFKGDQYQFSRHPGPDANRGKEAAGIGTNNSVHNISASLWERRCSRHVGLPIIERPVTLMDIGGVGLYSGAAFARRHDDELGPT